MHFASKCCLEAESRYHVTDLDTVALVFALHRFKFCKHGTRVIAVTDYFPLLSLFKNRNVSNQILRWGLELLSYQLEIK